MSGPAPKVKIPDPSTRFEELFKLGVEQLAIVHRNKTAAHDKKTPKSERDDSKDRALAAFLAKSQVNADLFALIVDLSKSGTTYSGPSHTRLTSEFFYQKLYSVLPSPRPPPYIPLLHPFYGYPELFLPGHLFDGHPKIQEYTRVVDLRDMMIEENAQHYVIQRGAEMVDMRIRMETTEETLKLLKAKYDSDKRQLIVRQFATTVENKFVAVVFGTDTEYRYWTMVQLRISYQEGFSNSRLGIPEDDDDWFGMYEEDRKKMHAMFMRYFKCSRKDIRLLWRKIEEAIATLKEGNPVAHPNHLDEGYTDETLKQVLDPLFPKPDAKATFNKLYDAALALDANFSNIGLTRHV